MSAVLLVPLLPLLAALIVVVGSASTRHDRARIAAWPIGAAFCGAIATLYIVATQGPITLRFYDPAAALSVPLPFGFYIDRLSAVMMVLISAIGTIIYTYSIDYMYQDPHERRYLAMIGIAVFVLRDRELAQIAQFQATALGRKTASAVGDYDLAAICGGLGVECLALDHEDQIDAVLDRVVHRAHRIELKGPSLRKRHAVIAPPEANTHAPA